MNSHAQEICLQDIRHAHEWATRALSGAESRNSPIAIFELKRERERLSARYAAVKRGADPDGKMASWRY